MTGQDLTGQDCVADMTGQDCVATRRHAWQHDTGGLLAVGLAHALVIPYPSNTTQAIWRRSSDYDESQLEYG